MSSEITAVVDNEIIYLHAAVSFSSGRLVFVAWSEEAATTFEVVVFFFLLQRFPLQKMLSLLEPLAVRTTRRRRQRRLAARKAVEEKNSERDFLGPFVLSLSTRLLASDEILFFIATVTQKCDIFSDLVAIGLDFGFDAISLSMV